jgi:Uncharacterized protein conserved in bacteria
MPSSRTVVATPNASRYLQQLCKHFAHKVTVEYTPQEAKVDFPFGDCRMWADEAELRIECASDSEDALARARFVIDDHLGRFAWREKPAIVWQAMDE